MTKWNVSRPFYIIYRFTLFRLTTFGASLLENRILVNLVSQNFLSICVAQQPRALRQPLLVRRHRRQGKRRSEQSSALSRCWHRERRKQHIWRCGRGGQSKQRRMERHRQQQLGQQLMEGSKPMELEQPRDRAWQHRRWQRTERGSRQRTRGRIKVKFFIIKILNNFTI